ncbi:hypothetical protein F4561_003942 [Lipingzhangella halophila]|uniref:DUF3558 domain-containing protein n=1 Tax=Lipingzhangella halophila TaxID=1783352 RepID=A0A7W7RJH4_9ACTN|nr:hypothetical protein [Lipingzhangella halophila]MBB4933122.1 hypothetical protein [Lipingzhangella halophila]
MATLAVLALLLMAGGVWGIIWLSSASGEYQAAPGCEVGQTSALDSLVSDYETDLDQPIKGLSEDWREGHECRWVTPEDGSEIPSAARMAIVHNSDHSKGDGEDEATSALREAAEGNSATAIDDLGDRALSWTETQSDFGWGCVGVQLSNLFVLSCYTAAVDFQASQSIPDEEAIAGAEELARETTRQIEDGDF